MKAKILKIGTACNNRCYFCFERGTAYETDTEAIKASITTARPECDQLTITGMEPSIHPAIIEIVKHAKELEYRTIQLVSNGRMFAYGHFAREMIFAGMTELLVPVHSHLPSVHNNITGVEKSLEQTMRGVRNILDNAGIHGPFNSVNVVAGTVVCAENVGALSMLPQFLQKYGIEQMFFIRMRKTPGTTPPPVEKIRASLPAALEAAGRNGMRAFTLGFTAEDIPLPPESIYEEYVKAKPVAKPADSFDIGFSDSLK